MKRFRLGTLLAWMAVLALALALGVHHRRAARREAQLRSALALYRSRAHEDMIDQLEQPRRLTYSQGALLEDVLKTIKLRTKSPSLPSGFPIYVDPVGLQE